MASMEVLSEEYLKSISSLAEKIGSDLNTTREAYQEVWFTLSDVEKKQVLDEAIIHPAAVLKYHHATSQPDISSCSDETVCNFSWFTRSQLDLFTTLKLKDPKQRMDSIRKPETFSPILVSHSDNSPNKGKQKDPTAEANLLNRLKNRVPVLKSSSSSEEKRSLVDAKSQSSLALKVISKPKTPPPPPPAKTNHQGEKRALLSVDGESDLGSQDNIPKTGFDFLDNW